METLASNQLRRVVFPEPSTIRTCGILSDTESLMKSLESKFNKDTEITLLVFKNEKREKGDESLAVFKSDLNFWGIPPKKFITHFVDKPFDILINMAGSSSDVLNYISASSFAKFKVSKAYSGKIYDLVISSNKMNDDQYLNEIFKTVENFNSK